MKRVVREGHEIGNHTYTHPDISEISSRQLDFEVKVTERLYASKLGIQPLYFRPPYDIDRSPIPTTRPLRSSTSSRMGTPSSKQARHQ